MNFPPTGISAAPLKDLQLLADLGWRIAEAKQMPRYNPDEQFARPRSGGEIGAWSPLGGLGW